MKASSLRRQFVRVVSACWKSGSKPLCDIIAIFGGKSTDMLLCNKPTFISIRTAVKSAIPTIRILRIFIIKYIIFGNKTQVHYMPLSLSAGRQVLQINQEIGMSRTHREQCKEEQELQVGLAGFWGYSLADPLDLKEKKQRHNAPPTVTNITLRKFGKQIQKTEKILQIQAQIRALQNQRQLMRLNEQASSQPQTASVQKSSIIRMMQQKIEEYNYIVQHRHIMDKGSDESRKIFKLETKSEAEKILEEIEKEKKKIVGMGSDLGRQTAANKQIAKLYRMYQEKLGSGGSNVTIHHGKSIAPEPPKSSMSRHEKEQEDLNKLDDFALNMNKYYSLKMNNSADQIMEMQEKYRKCSMIEGEAKTTQANRWREAEYKNYRTQRKGSRDGGTGHGSTPQQAAFEKELLAGTLKVRDKRRLQHDVSEPFVDRKEIEHYKAVQTKIRSNSQALDLWRSKIQEVCSTSRVYRQLQEKEKEEQLQKERAEKELERREQELEGVISKDIRMMQGEKISSAYSKEMLMKDQLKEQEQENIFAELLRKKNNKFNKLWGTRILVKFNSHQKAKSLLKGQSEHPPSRATTRSSSRNAPRNLSLSSQLHPKSKVEEPKSDEAMWLQEQKDEEHYWRMCKNEKINLLLKRR